MVQTVLVDTHDGGNDGGNAKNLKNSVIEVFDDQRPQGSDFWDLFFIGSELLSSPFEVVRGSFDTELKTGPESFLKALVLADFNKIF